MKICVVGTGYVGLVTAAVLADLGHHVIGVDRDQSKLDKIKSGVSPIYEPGLDEILARNIANGNLVTTTSVAEGTRSAEVVFIAVGTPPMADGTPDISMVKAVAAEVATAIDKPTVVVNKSTVPVGTGDLVEDLILDAGVPQDLFTVVSNPEFLREGSAIWDTLNPDRIVIGTDDEAAAEKMKAVYAPLNAPTLVVSRPSAELIKYASNSFLAVKISFINAISRICERCGGDVEQVSIGMGMDKRIGDQFLKAGLGWGGSCFPKDVQGLTKTGERLGYRFDLLTAADQINNEQTLHFLTRLQARLGSLRGKTIGLLGLAFKPNTDDIRDAKSLEIIDFLTDQGANVVAHDPVAMPNVKQLHPGICYMDRPADVFSGADAVILVTEWEEFRKLDLGALKGVVNSPVLFDGRRLWQRDEVESAGWEYFTVGV
ncbi:MAG: UDP-glucose/GDP-mannose dehydrogenase family protein [Fimbriimonadaceae bacterium]|nr:UDP-glucose/GDP-mannose dehydrogenase family protein [Fimbriimonadaceae bacterium]